VVFTLAYQTDGMDRREIKMVVNKRIRIDIGKYLSIDGGISWTRKHGKLMDLPPGYKSRIDRGHGYDFLDDQGEIIEQHPVDDNAIRTMVWNIYYRKIYVAE